MAEETTKKQLKEKLYNERKMWRETVAKERESRKAIQQQTDEALEEVKTAFQNLASTIVRSYGIEMINGDFELHIPIPEGGWITAGKRVGNEYVLVAKKIEG